MSSATPASTKTSTSPILLARDAHGPRWHLQLSDGGDSLCVLMCGRLPEAVPGEMRLHRRMLLFHDVETNGHGGLSSSSPPHAIRSRDGG